MTWNVSQVTNNSPSLDFSQPHKLDQTTETTDTHGYNSFTVEQLISKGSI